MTREEACARRDEALEAYSHIGKINSVSQYGSGHINDTFLVVSTDKRYVLQRINDSVFPHPREVMENIEKVTNHIRKKAKESTAEADTDTEVKEKSKLRLWSENFWMKTVIPIPRSTSMNGTISPGNGHVCVMIRFTRIICITRK